MVSVLQERNLLLVYSKNFFFFTWKFDESDIKPGSTIRSSEFKLVSEASFLEMKIDEDGACYLNLFNPSENIKCGHFTLLISDADDSVVHSEIASSNYFMDEGLEIDLLGSFNERIPFDVKYPIIMSCISRVWDRDKVSTSSLDSAVLFNLRELSLDLKKVLDQSSDSDIVLNVDGDSIKAHRMMLKARSSVFHRMLTHEEAAEEVVISDVGPETMKRLINYLYTGSTEECGFEGALELYYASDKYQVISLRDNCKTELLSLLEVNNACILFALASRHSDEDFKNEVTRFIKADFKSVVQTESFGELSRDDMKLLTRLCVCEP